MARNGETNQGFKRRMGQIPRSRPNSFLVSLHEKFPTNVKDMVHRVLSIPIGSSDCERAFSILFHIRSKRRNKLGEDTLENMLRIRLNGPKTINQFASLEYAKAWALSNNMLTDYPGGFKKDQPEPLLGEDEEEKKTLLDGSTLF